MDVADPRINYILIDEFIEAGYYQKAINYIMKLGANVPAVFNMYYNSIGKEFDGLIMGDEFYHTWSVNYITKPYYVKDYYVTKEIHYPTKIEQITHPQILISTEREVCLDTKNEVHFAFKNGGGSALLIQTTNHGLHGGQTYCTDLKYDITEEWGMSHGE